jgi:hypothetical protein
MMMNVIMSFGPKQPYGSPHEQGGDTKRGSKSIIFSSQWNRRNRQDGTDIDTKVKVGKKVLHMTFG